MYAYTHKYVHISSYIYITIYIYIYYICWSVSRVKETPSNIHFKKPAYNIRYPQPKTAVFWIFHWAQVRSIPGTSSTVAVVPKLLTEGVDEASNPEEMSCAIAIFREAYSSWVTKKGKKQQTKIHEKLGGVDGFGGALLKLEIPTTAEVVIPEAWRVAATWMLHHGINLNLVIPSMVFEA